MIAFFIEGGNTNALKIKVAACSPTAMMSYGGSAGSFSGFSIQEANSSLSIGGQPKLHFPKLFGKLSCPLLKENQIPTNRCSCKQLLISIKHSLKSFIQTTPLPIPVISKQVLRGKGNIYIKKTYLQNHVNDYFQTPILNNQSINGCHY